MSEHGIGVAVGGMIALTPDEDGLPNGRRMSIALSDHRCPSPAPMPPPTAECSPMCGVFSGCQHRAVLRNHYTWAKCGCGFVQAELARLAT